MPWVQERPQPDLAGTAEPLQGATALLSLALREVTQAGADVGPALARRLGIRPLDCAAMEHVMTGRLGPAELSARLGISTGSGTELVDRLERSGHLVRERHPHDRRRVALRATESTVADVLAALSPLLVAINALAADFTPDEQETITRYLREAARRLRDYAHPAAPPSTSGGVSTSQWPARG